MGGGRKAPAQRTGSAARCLSPRTQDFAIDSAVYLEQVAMNEPVPGTVSFSHRAVRNPKSCPHSGVSTESEVAQVTFSSKTLAQEGMIWKSY